MKLFIAGLVMLCSSISFAAAHDLYQFDSPDQAQIFTHLTNELRCLVCQNETLADSNAGLAKDLRAEIYQQLQQGADEASIKKYLLSRYGQFILFKPAVNSLTLFLWMFPLLLLGLGTTIYLLIMRQGRRVKSENT